MADIYNEEDIIIPETPIVLDTIDDSPVIPMEPEAEPIPQPIEPVGTDTPVEQPNYTIGQYLGTLQESVVSIWKYHLHAKKHWIHVELDSLYHSMLELVDTVIEQYQGIVMGELSTTDYVNVLPVSDDMTELIFLMQLRDFVITGRKQLFEESLTELWSSIDDIIGTLDQTIYKLNSFQEQPIQTFEAFCYEHCGHCDDGDSEEEE